MTGARAARSTCCDLQELDQLGVAEVGREPGRALVAAAALLARDPRHVDPAVDGAQADLASGAGRPRLSRISAATEVPSSERT